MKNNSNIVTLIIYKEKIMLEDTLPKPLTTGSLDDLLVASNGNEQDYNVLLRYFSFGLHRLKRSEDTRLNSSHT